MRSTRLCTTASSMNGACTESISMRFRPRQRAEAAAPSGARLSLPRRVRRGHVFDVGEREKGRGREHRTRLPIRRTLKINTYFHYEKSCFVDEARRILSRLPQDSVYRPMADTILAQLAGVEQIDIGLVPENSLLWEFLKK